MVFGYARSSPRCLASQDGRNDVRQGNIRREPREAAVPVASAHPRRASGSLTDALHRSRLPSYPGISRHDLYGSLSLLLGIGRPAPPPSQPWDHTLWVAGRGSGPALRSPSTKCSSVAASRNGSVVAQWVEHRGRRLYRSRHTAHKNLARAVEGSFSRRCKYYSRKGWRIFHGRPTRLVDTGWWRATSSASNFTSCWGVATPRSGARKPRKWGLNERSPSCAELVSRYWTRAATHTKWLGLVW